MIYNLLKNIIMKKNFLIAMLGICLVVFAASCSKSDPEPVTFASAEGKWDGNYNNGIGGPIFYFSLNFKPGGVLVVQANSSTAPDIANGTWNQVADVVSGTYTYVGSSAIYSYTGKYNSSNPKIMNGTIGLQPSTTGAGEFTVTKN